jgi:hypothetical protein
MTKSKPRAAVPSAFTITCLNCAQAGTLSIDIACTTMSISHANRHCASDNRPTLDVATLDEPVHSEVDHFSTGQLAHTGNKDRARWALTALRAFSETSGSEPYEESISDLVTDLAHLADEHDIDFLDLMSRAIGTWSIERKDPDSELRRPRVRIIIEG